MSEFFLHGRLAVPVTLLCAAETLATGEGLAFVDDPTTLSLRESFRAGSHEETGVVGWYNEFGAGNRRRHVDPVRLHADRYVLVGRVDDDQPVGVLARIGPRPITICLAGLQRRAEIELVFGEPPQLAVQAITPIESEIAAVQEQ